VIDGADVLKCKDNRILGKLDDIETILMQRLAAEYALHALYDGGVITLCESHLVEKARPAHRIKSKPQLTGVGLHRFWTHNPIR
jgi:hypothetical protein